MYTYNSFKTLDDFVNTMWGLNMTDTVFKTLGNYPPYDILKETSGNTTYYILNMALAGFKKEDIEVLFIQDQLIIRPTSDRIKKDKQEMKRYVNRGISNKEFQRTFAVDKSLSVESVTFVDGILSIRMKVNSMSDDVKRFEIK